MIEEQVIQIYKENNFGKIPKKENKVFYKTRMKVHYYLGISLKHLKRENVKNLEDLINVAKKHYTNESEFQKDLKLEFSGITNW